ncbi:MAG: hypothetical protein KAJ10_02690 [Thermodesulfovibrionia bacterium]|nr:hypothetical protein [Thermodesulfovibrionia bacterium]
MSTSIVAAYTNKEGGHWIVPSIAFNIEDVNNFMDQSLWRYEPMAAILFYNGAIYDLVLHRLHYFPWRHIKGNYPRSGIALIGNENYKMMKEILQGKHAHKLPTLIICDDLEDE